MAVVRKRTGVRGPPWFELDAWPSRLEPIDVGLPNRVEQDRDRGVDGVDRTLPSAGSLHLHGCPNSFTRPVGAGITLLIPRDVRRTLLQR